MSPDSGTTPAVCDAEGRIVSATDSFAAACGLKPELLRGTSLFDLIPTNWQADAIKSFCAALRGVKTDSVTFPVKIRDGQTAPAVLSRTDGGVGLAFSETGPGQAASRFFDSSSDPCFVLDKKLRIRDANLAATAFYGLGKFDLLSRNFTSLGSLPPDAFAQDAACGRCTVRHQNGAGETRELELACSSSGGGFYATLHDFTGLRRENISLRESAERFRLMAESAPGCFYMIAPDWSQVYFAGPLFEKIFGRTREEFYANPALMLTVIHPDDREKAMKAYSAQSGVAEYRITLPGGETRAVRDFVIPVFDDEGEVKAYTGYIETMEEIGYMTKEHVPYSAHSDAAAVFIEKTAQLARILGYAGPEELMSVPPEQLYTNPARRAELARRLAATGYLREEPVEYIAKDGRLMWVSVSADRATLPDGKDWFDTVVNDITAIRETEIHIENSTALPEFSELASGLVMADIVKEEKPRFRFTACNPAFERIAGVREDRILGRFADDVFRRDSVRRALAVLEDAAGRNMPVNFNYTASNGTHYRVAAFFPAENEIAAVLTDISALRRAQEELELSHSRLRDLTAKLHTAREEERQTLSRELHDGLASRLTAAKLVLGTAREMAKDGGKDLRLKLENVEKRLEEIMEETRRIAGSLRSPVLDDLGLPEAARLLVDDFRSVSGIGCSLRVDEECRALPCAYKTAVFRIIQEALANIISHSKAERAKVGITCRGGKLILAVQDGGRGIGEDTLNSPKSLGLLSMRERAAALGGELKIVTGENKGTLICAHIPLDAACTPDTETPKDTH